MSSLCPVPFVRGMLSGMISMRSLGKIVLQVPACPARCRSDILRVNMYMCIHPKIHRHIHAHESLRLSLRT